MNIIHNVFFGGINGHDLLNLTLKIFKSLFHSSTLMDSLFSLFHFLSSFSFLIATNPKVYPYPPSHYVNNGYVDDMSLPLAFFYIFLFGFAYLVETYNIEPALHPKEFSIEHIENLRVAEKEIGYQFISDPKISALTHPEPVNLQDMTNQELLQIYFPDVFAVMWDIGCVGIILSMSFFMMQDYFLYEFTEFFRVNTILRAAQLPCFLLIAICVVSLIFSGIMYCQVYFGIWT